MRRWAFRALMSSILGLSLIGSACGSSGGGSPASTGSKGTITVAGFNFPESNILANVYGGALHGIGYTVNYKPSLGAREVVAPALQRGDIDMYIGYAATDLEFYNKGAGEASGNVTATTAKLNSHLGPLKLAALNPSAAVDQNAFAMTKANAQKFNATKLSDLASVGNQIVLGGPPECANRPFCDPGLEQTYGIHF